MSNPTDTETNKEEELSFYGDMRERILYAFETMTWFGLFFLSLFVYTMLFAFGAGIIYTIFK